VEKKLGSAYPAWKEENARGGGSGKKKRGIK